MYRRSGIVIMGKMIGLVKPLFHVMVGAILLGVIGYLCAIFLTILAGMGVLDVLGARTMAPLHIVFLLLIVLGVLRGVLHYGEQACNHYIAFKILGIIRHRVFGVLRKLAPAKLEGRDKGNLISIITSDIELLEVFYAHTISPVAIAATTSFIMSFFIGYFYLPAGILAFVGYLTMGIILPLWNARKGKDIGMEYRNEFGDMNSFILDQLRGISETIQYGCGEKQKSKMENKSIKLGKTQESLQKLEGNSRAVTNAVVLLFSFGMFFLTLNAYRNGQNDFSEMLICTISMMASFGPTIALSNLSNNLHQTLASGERVLALLEETPIVEETKKMPKTEFDGASCDRVTFSYEEETILEDYSLAIPEGEIIGIHGKSGSGKSTLLKLLMRFWDSEKGAIKISGTDIKEVNTNDLRNMESFVTQDTYLFQDSIAANIAVAKQGATLAEIKVAAKKASIHEFIDGLPKGYATQVGELGDTLSGGERQRLGIARAFLHQAPFLLLDEPTSNLDSLNEGIILKSLKEACEGQTVILVSHRKSTMNIANRIYKMAEGRSS